MTKYISGSNPSVQQLDWESQQSRSTPLGGGQGNQQTLDHAGFRSLAPRVSAAHRMAFDDATPGSSDNLRSRNGAPPRTPTWKLGPKLPDKLDVLMWPNGLSSTGQVRQTLHGPVFEADMTMRNSMTDCVIPTRKGFWKHSRSAVAARPLPVVPLANDSKFIQRFAVKLPSILAKADFDEQGDFLVRKEYPKKIAQPALDRCVQKFEMTKLSSVSLKKLASVACVAGGGEEDAGILCDESVVFQTLLVRSLDAIAPHCIDPQAIRNVIQTLAEDINILRFEKSNPLLNLCKQDEASDQSIYSNFGMQSFYSKLNALQEKQHLYIPVEMRDYSIREAHALGLNFQKEQDGNVRVGVINSNGWPQGGRVAQPIYTERRDQLAFFKSVSVDAAASAMQKLLNNQVPQRPRTVCEETWNAPDRGFPLLAWLESVGREWSKPSANFEGNGKSFKSAPQKAGDCGIEHFFAFMATAMPQADYKLAKAACLNTLLQVIDRALSAEAKEPAIPVQSELDGVAKSSDRERLYKRDALEYARFRLQERITSSLSGAMLAAAPRLDLNSSTSPPSPPSPVMAHTLTWPDGRESVGHVRQTEGGAVFEATALWRDKVLVDRRRKQAAAAPYNAPLRPLPVTLAGDGADGQYVVPKLPAVLTQSDFTQEGHLRMARNVYLGPSRCELIGTRESLVSVAPEELALTIRATSGDIDGDISNVGSVVLAHLFGRSLSAIALQCSDPQAVRNVARALDDDFGMLYLMKNTVLNGSKGAVVSEVKSAKASFDVTACQTKLEGLSPGQSWFLPVQQVALTHESAEDPGCGMRKSLGIGIQKREGGGIRVSVINPQGWIGTPLENFKDSLRSSLSPAVFKIVTADEAAIAMKELLDQPMPPIPQGLSKEEWNEPFLGMHLHTWLQRMGPKDSLVSHHFHGGQPLRSMPFKCKDDDTETLFAFMATELLPADYKLAKAACLNTLLQVADQQEVRANLSPQELEALQAMRQRLLERITSSLGGAMMAPPFLRP